MNSAHRRALTLWQPDLHGLWLSNPRRIIWASRRFTREGDGDLGLPFDMACCLLWVHTRGAHPRDILQVLFDLETDETDVDLLMVLDLLRAGLSPATSRTANHAQLRVAVAHDWMHRYGAASLLGCLRAGLTRNELKAAYETGTFPSADRLATLSALRQAEI